MTTVFSALPMPKGGRFLRRPDIFGKGKAVEETIYEAHKYFDPDEVEITSTEVDQRPNLRDLNDALRVLIEVFPDVQAEVFREMLLSLSEESRLEVVTEHLLRDDAKFVQGRYRKSVKDDKITKTDGAGTKNESSKSSSNTTAVNDIVTLQQDETFRSEEYKLAVKLAFYQEFKNLSHSTIKAVLAENNYSYTLSRPTIQQVLSRSWRFTLTNFWTRKRVNTSEADTHPLIDWRPDLTGSESLLPCLKRTKSLELNRELYNTYIAPILARQREDLLWRDQAVADQLNETEADEAEAMFDCECCYTPTTFEQITTCDGCCHFVCFRCIRHAVNEALYGQGWARNIDAAKASLRCLAPSADICQGCLPSDLIERALCAEKDGIQTWHKFQERIASEALIKSQLPLLRCPFCVYAEIDEMPALHFKSPLTVAFQVGYIPHHFWNSLATLVFILIYPLLFPFLPFLSLSISILYKPLHARLHASQSRILRKRRGLRFTCRSPTCARTSCTNCLSPWRDPHTCHADSLQSLRQAIESATTHSIKRVCPKCSLSFIKDSGCNKLVCNCGYVMCYICRQEIGSREGYGHFCQHFRERPGVRCVECDKCDLYVAEDEAGVIKRAAREAEREWLEKEALRTGSVEVAAMDRVKYGGVVTEVLRGKQGRSAWDWNGLIDAGMDAVLA